MKIYILTRYLVVINKRQLLEIITSFARIYDALIAT